MTTKNMTVTGSALKMGSALGVVPVNKVPATVVKEAEVEKTVVGSNKVLRISSPADAQPNWLPGCLLSCICWQRSR